ncbi:MAG TPA: Rrf2 family transcriptional regulator [Prolixibacteraceae bacterium]|nr:Rrf2 family transcriptional regulator [Prolixibacteraceae bacterium]
MLTKSTEYAIRALVFIQLKNNLSQRPGVLEVANEIEAPAAFTAKILQTLTRHELIGSIKGRGGGFFFTNQNKTLSLYKVISIMEGNSVFTRCGFGLSQCSDSNPCPLHHRYAAIRDGYLQIAQTETIQSLAAKIERGEAVLNTLTKS